jgi:hypothetical protein
MCNMELETTKELKLFSSSNLSTARYSLNKTQLSVFNLFIGSLRWYEPLGMEMLRRPSALG